MYRSSKVSPYTPQEDSFLLKEFVKRCAKGIVLDMGTGSGIQAKEAAHSKRTSEIYAVDISRTAIKYAKKNLDGKKHKKIKWIIGDLFSRFKSVKYLHYFDTIIFNPPYLPENYRTKDTALTGGKTGARVIERFLMQAGRHLKPNGKILLVFSSLTKGVQNLIAQNLFTGKELGKLHVFFEDIYVYLLERNPVLNQLEKKGLCNIKYFAKGKRGIVFTADYKKKKVAVKIKRQDSFAQGGIAHEAEILKEIGMHGLGPKYLFSSKNYLVYEFVEGKYLKEMLKSGMLGNICRKVFEQCYQLDLLHINKQEMTRPYKHVIVNRGKITLIDFERARKTDEAHNVTQFCSFTMKHFKHRKKWIELARAYRQTPARENLNRMIRLL